MSPATSDTPVLDLRRELKGRPENRFVEWEQFVELLTSRRKLLRSDRSGARVRGLRDPAAGVTFLVEEERIPSLAACSGASPRS